MLLHLSFLFSMWLLPVYEDTIAYPRTPSFSSFIGFTTRPSFFLNITLVFCSRLGGRWGFLAGMANLGRGAPFNCVASLELRPSSEGGLYVGALGPWHA